MARFENAPLLWSVLAERANKQLGLISPTIVRELLGFDGGQMRGAMRVIFLHCRANRLPQLDVLVVAKGKPLPTHEGAPRTKLAYDLMLKRVLATAWDLNPPAVWSSEVSEQGSSGSASGASVSRQETQPRENTWTFCRSLLLLHRSMRVLVCEERRCSPAGPT